MRNELLLHDKKCSSSVIVIAWGGGSSPPYAQAAANIRLVGATTAHIIHMIYVNIYDFIIEFVLIYTSFCFRKN